MASFNEAVMKKNLDWEHKEVANIFDEVTLWSAPFGRMLLENIPMMPRASIVDIGFGTGFPLIELSQRFGDESKIYGIDIWKEGINRTKEKIKTLGLSNIEILDKSAAKINLEDQQIDLVTSNLGVNNFEQKEAVYQEIHRILKPKGRLSITTNPVGTFEELFDVFSSIFKALNLKEEQISLAKSIGHRSTEREIISALKQHGFTWLKTQSDSTNMRFVDAEALLNHSLIRIGFRKYWEEMFSAENRAQFFEQLIIAINQLIGSKGEFTLTIPMLYLEFEKA